MDISYKNLYIQPGDIVVSSTIHNTISLSGCFFKHAQVPILLVYATSIPSIWAPHDKTNKMTVRPAKTQINLGIHPVWSVFSVRSMGS